MHVTTLTVEGTFTCKARLYVPSYWNVWREVHTCTQVSHVVVPQARQVFSFAFRKSRFSLATIFEDFSKYYVVAGRMQLVEMLSFSLIRSAALKRSV